MPLLVNISAGAPLSCHALILARWAELLRWASKWNWFGTSVSQTLQRIRVSWRSPSAAGGLAGVGVVAGGLGGGADGVLVCGGRGSFEDELAVGGVAFGAEETRVSVLLRLRGVFESRLKVKLSASRFCFLVSTDVGGGFWSQWALFRPCFSVSFQERDWAPVRDGPVCESRVLKLAVVERSDLNPSEWDQVDWGSENRDCVVVAVVTCAAVRDQVVVARSADWFDRVTEVPGWGLNKLFTFANKSATPFSGVLWDSPPSPRRPTEAESCRFCDDNAETFFCRSEEKFEAVDSYRF